MAATARALSHLNAFVVAPISLLAYVGALWLTGAIEKDHVDALQRLIRRKLSAAGAAPAHAGTEHD
jgi:hypothetical protein